MKSVRPFRLTHKQKNTHKQTTSRLTHTQKKKPTNEQSKIGHTWCTKELLRDRIEILSHPSACHQ